MGNTEEIVIIGGGIVGCTTAYYLSHHPKFADGSVKVTILEASSGVAHGASGKAGGLVAQWAYPREVVDVSFPEHVRLAEKYNGKEKWGWRFVGMGNWTGRGEEVSTNTGSGVGKGGRRKSLEKTGGLSEADVRTAKGLPEDLLWVKANLTDSYSPIAADGSTAQVHPYLFTTSMLELAQSKGVKFIPQAKVDGIEIQDGKVTSVTYGSKRVTANTVVLAAGAWSPTLVSKLPIAGTRAHSIVVRPLPPAQISPYVLFTEIRLPNSVVTPEIYARPTNEVYACGPGDDSSLPATVDDVEVDELACQSIFDQLASISDQLAEGTVIIKQACFLPTVTRSGDSGPIIGEATSIAKGLVIATGHTCWGICNAPGTAKAICELVMEGKIRCADLGKFHPSRFLT